MTTETNAERLERIKNLPTYTPFTITSVDINKIDLDWLIQQAERAQELEQEKEFFGRSFVELKAGDVITRKENAHLRKALEDMKRSFNAEFAPMMTHDAKVYLSSRIDAALKGESE